MSQALLNLDGCVALVTGASRVMGCGVAETLARLGATVAVNDFYPERAEAAAAEIRARGLKALAAPADVGAGVAYLASRETEWVTGQVYPLNGGALTA